MRRVFMIQDRFALPKGIVLTGTPFPETVDCRLSASANVSVRSEGTEVFTAAILGFELMRNTWSPDEPRPMAILIDDCFAKHTIPERAEVWVSDVNILPAEAQKPNKAPEPTP